MARVAEQTTTLRRQALIAGATVVAILSAAFVALWLVIRSRPHDLNGLLLFLIPFGLLAVAKMAADVSLIYIRGYLGERRVLKELRKLPDDYWVFNDIDIRVNGDAAQIDHVLVSPYGVWCIETKSHRGTIRGKEREHTWTQIKRSDSGRRYRKKFYNPIAQNATHCQRLGDYLKQHVGVTPPVKSAVVFTGARLEVDTATPVVAPRELRGVIQASDTRPRLEEKELRMILDALAHHEGPREESTPPAEGKQAPC